MSRRWAILAAYALLAASTQLLWLAFAPVDTSAARAMHVDVATVGYLALVFPLVYVLLALPTGRWLDASFSRALGLGALLTSGGALVRLVDPSSFPVQLAGQLVISAGQPLVLNSITKVVARNFPPEERVAAISIGTVALFVGILAAAITAPVLFAAGGLRLLLAVQAVPALTGALLMLFALRSAPLYPDDPAARVSLRWLASDRLMYLLAALIFIGMGTYNAVATWLQPILERFGQGGAAGNLIAVMTVGGIAGAALIPALAAARDRRRQVVVAALGVTALSFVAIDIGHSPAWIGAWLLLQGFFLMACLPIVLDWSELHAGPERAGSAAGFLLLAGNLGGVVLVLLVQVVLGVSHLPFLTLAAAALVGVPFALRLPARLGVRATPARG